MQKRCVIHHPWTQEEVPGTIYGLSDNGWSNIKLFESWLCEHFLKYVMAAHSLLLLLEGHSTHYQPHFTMDREKEVLILCFPPHTTYEAQPLDCNVFSPTNGITAYATK